MKRGGRLSPTSKKRIAELKERPAIRTRVFERDGGCLAAGLSLWGACFGPLTFHHVLKEGQGGKYTETNGKTLCAHHNDLIEADAHVAKDAAARGWAVHFWEVP